MSIDEQIKAALERVTSALRAKGYVVDEFSHPSVYFAGRRWLVQASRQSHGRDVEFFGETLSEAIDGLLAKIADLPPRWSDDQVAATLGIGVAA